MGNSDPDPRVTLGFAMPSDQDPDRSSTSYSQERQQQQHHHQQQQFHRSSRVGLMPTDGHDAYKKSAARSSRRSRAERTSYLMATGHLDPEETRQLNPSRGDNSQTINLNHSSNRSQQKQTQPPASDLENSTTSFRTTRNLRIAESILNNTSSDLDQSLLDDHRKTRGDMKNFRLHEQLFGDESHSTRKSSRKSKNSKLSTPYSNQLVSRSGPTYFVDGNQDQQDDSQSRGKFRQTYTEVSLPMKTSPAFEYILKDNRRRNKRCCMWLLYSTLILICLAIIVFSTIHLVMRYQNNS